MPSPTTKARRRRGFNIPPLHLNPILEISEEMVTFADYSFKFPLPPVSTSVVPRSPRVSPLSSPTVLSSSPVSQDASLPLTPTRSDDDEFPKKRAAIKPLVITKLPRSEARRFPVIDRSETYDEEESDSEWYSREFSKIIDTTPSPTYFPAAHRESFSVAPPAHYGYADLGSSMFDDVCYHPFANRPLPRMSIPDDVCSPWVDAEPSPWSGVCSNRLPFLSLSLPVSPFFDPDVDSVEEQEQQLSDLWLGGGGDEDDRLSFAFVFEDAEDGRRDEKSIQLVSPKRMSSVLPICTPSPPLSPSSSSSPLPSPSSPLPSPSPLPLPSRTPRPLPPLPTSVPLVPLRPQRCSTMTSISSLSFPPSPILSRESLLPIDEFADDGEGDGGDDDERRYGLKSRWSSSTLGEECEHDSSILNASKKLKTYFRGAKRASSSSPSSSSSSASPATKISIPSPIKFRAKEQNKNKKKKKKKVECRGHGAGGGALNGEGLVIRPQDSFLPRVEEEETRFRTGLGRSCEVASVPAPVSVPVPVPCCSLSSSSRRRDFLDVQESGGVRGLRRKPIPEEMLVRAA